MPLSKKAIISVFVAVILSTNNAINAAPMNTVGGVSTPEIEISTPQEHRPSTAFPDLARKNNFGPIVDDLNKDLLIMKIKDTPHPTATHSKISAYYKSTTENPHTTHNHHHRFHFPSFRHSTTNDLDFYYIQTDLDTILASLRGFFFPPYRTSRDELLPILPPPTTHDELADYIRAAGDDVDIRESYTRISHVFENWKLVFPKLKKSLVKSSHSHSHSHSSSSSGPRSPSSGSSSESSSSSSEPLPTPESDQIRYQRLFHYMNILLPSYIHSTATTIEDSFLHMIDSETSSITYALEWQRLLDLFKTYYETLQQTKLAMRYLSCKYREAKHHQPSPLCAKTPPKVETIDAFLDNLHIPTSPISVKSQPCSNNNRRCSGEFKSDSSEASDNHVHSAQPKSLLQRVFSWDRLSQHSNSQFPHSL